MATLTHPPSTVTHTITANHPNRATFSTQMRQEFSRHRQEWTRFYLPLIEILRQRGLIARLDRLSKCSCPSTSSSSTQPSNPSEPIPTPKETLTVLTATTHVVSEWALKLHVPGRFQIALNAIKTIDEFSLAILTRVSDLSAQIASVHGGNDSWSYISAVELGQCGAKIRASREAIVKCFSGRSCSAAGGDMGKKERDAQVRSVGFAGLLGWVERVHSRCVAGLVVGRVSAGAGGGLPVEIVEMVWEEMQQRDGESGGGGPQGLRSAEVEGMGEEHARWAGQVYTPSSREESRVLSRAGVAIMEVSRSAAITA